MSSVKPFHQVQSSLPRIPSTPVILCHVSRHQFWLPIFPAVNQCPPVPPPPPPAPHPGAESQTTSHRGPPPPPVPTFVRRLQPTVAHRHVVGCHLFHADVLCENPSHLDCPAGFCDAHCANTRCRSALPPRRGRRRRPREPRQPPLPSNDTPPVVTPSHRPPVGSPPSPNTYRRSGSSEPTHLECAAGYCNFFLVTAADAHTIPVSSRETARVQCLGGAKAARAVEHRQVLLL